MAHHHGHTHHEADSHNHCHGCGSSCGCGHGHAHTHGSAENRLKTFSAELICGALMAGALIAFHYISISGDREWIKAAAYIVSLLPVGIPVAKGAWRTWRSGNIFNEFTLMILASAGAFLIGEYPEGVAVLLFYSIGEKLEDVVSGDVRNQIKNLVGKMPKYATVATDAGEVRTKPEDVKVGDVIVVKPGESLPLDGVLISPGEADMDTSAMTGESVPRVYSCGQEVPSGIIPVDKEVRLRVTHPYADSAMMKIIKMIEDSSANRAPSETILRNITRWYTPLVMAGAILFFTVPWLMGIFGGFDFVGTHWFRVSLVFLVCSCPCALVVSIPLTYFAAIGISARGGILFKGHRQLDDMRKFTVMLFDKTGTVTTGKFRVTGVEATEGHSADEVLGLAAAVDARSAHPLAVAIVAEAKEKGVKLPEVSDVKSVSHGMTARMGEFQISIGSAVLMQRMGIRIPAAHAADATTRIYLAKGHEYLGAVALADTVKAGSAEAIERLHRMGIRKIGILSGDREETVAAVAKDTGVDFYRSALLPGQKEDIVKEYGKKNVRVAFAGDGVNDAPALAASGVGIAMGTLGSDIAIESADVVVSGDDLRKIPEGIKISRKVRTLLIENITFAFGVKLLVMVLGALGTATLWAAVFADTGVTVITVLWTLIYLKIWRIRKKN